MAVSIQMNYPLADNEDERIRALDSFGQMNTFPDSDFDQIVQMASRIFDVPVALISLVHRDRQFFKARVGLDVCETGRNVSFCTYAIMAADVFVVPDASLDPRFSDNALVTGYPWIRFYAGAPLLTKAGHGIGSLCLIDNKPRLDFSERDRRVLQDLASMVLDRMEFRRLECSDRESRSRFRNIASTSPDGIICADSNNRITSWNGAAEAMFGYSVEEALGRSLDIIVPKAMHARHGAGLARVAAGGPARIIGTSVNLTACRRDGSEFPIELSLSQWSESGERFFGAIIRDITLRAEAERQMKLAAEFDHLTGLSNRPSLNRQMNRACSVGAHATVVLIDLDGFKDVNDMLGHSAGDFVLQVIAERLRKATADDQMVARLGGDEFVIFLTGTADPLKAANLGLSLIALIEEPIEFEDQPIHIGASIGIAVTIAGDCNYEELLGNADLALYQAKGDGRHLVRVFTPELRQSASRKGAISSSLRQAWQRREFELYYQPQVNLANGRLTGAEALIRWNHPTLGVVSPSAFLPVLEVGLLAVPVGEWILRSACRQAARWRRAGIADFRIGVNLFAAQFRTRDFAEVVEAILEEFDLPPAALELEITENIILQNEQRIMQPLRRLRALGVGIAFDDFGTGFASLSLLKDYPVSRLKIDRSFVSGVDRSEKDGAIIEAVVKLADGFSLEVIAEGIETEEQEMLMRHYNCDEGQGYLYGRPMTVDAFEQRYLANGGRSDAAVVVARMGDL